MANRFIFENNAITTLAVNAAPGDTSLILTSGSDFPTPGAGQQFAITLLDAATGLVNEIVYCTARSGNTLTVVRARENTTAAAWPAGSTASNFITRDALASFAQFGSSSQYWVAGGTANALTITPSPTYSDYFTGMAFLVGVASNNGAAATLSVNGLSAQPIRDQNGVAITADMLVAGRIQPLVYDGSVFRMVTAPPPASFIKTLATAGSLVPSNKIAVDQSGVAYSVDLGSLITLIGSSTFGRAYFLGMM